MKKLIIKTSLIAFTSFALISCSGEVEMEKDDQFCECLKATDDLTEVSSKLMEGDITEEDRKKVLELTAAKKKLCDKYSTLSGKENLKRKELCEKK